MKWTRDSILRFLEQELAMAAEGGELSAERLADLVQEARAEKAPRRQGEGRPTYRQEWVRCTKPGCKACKEGPGHGPYWYAYQRVDGKLRKRYVGKELPAGEGGGE